MFQESGSNSFLIHISRSLNLGNSHCDAVLFLHRILDLCLKPFMYSHFPLKPHLFLLPFSVDLEHRRCSSNPLN